MAKKLSALRLEEHAPDPAAEPGKQGGVPAPTLPRSASRALGTRSRQA